MDEVIAKAMKQYEAQKHHSAKYYNKKKQEKIENGTYKGRGRPRKVKEESTSTI